MHSVIYDTETFPNVFTICLKQVGGPGVWFEISDRRRDNVALRQYLLSLKTMIGFNNMAFDWPILKFFLENPDCQASDLYDYAQEIIRKDRFEVIDWRPAIDQIDLFKIWHFDNRAKTTSLKKLEFNMRSPRVQSLPFKVGTYLNSEEIDTLLVYNANDVCETERFFTHSREAIELRQSINPKWMNQSDTGMGRRYFEAELERYGVATRDANNQPLNTFRKHGVMLGDVIFKTPVYDGIASIIDYLSTVNVYDNEGERYAKRGENDWSDLKLDLAGVPISMGLGGIHGSVDSKAFLDGGIYDFDVTSFYPNISINYNIYPEHLGPQFCKVYQDLLTRRMGYAKGTPENKAIKLSLNSVFGSSGSEFTSFYDLAYMLGTTINGQLMLLALARDLVNIPGCQLIQVNTDGLTVYVPNDSVPMMKHITGEWEQNTGLPLECNEYSRMWIRDVNNYIAEYTNGKRKLKGAYSYKREWWQNFSALVVPKVVEAVMCDGADAETLLRNHTDPWDFMMRLDLRGNTIIRTSDGDEYSGVIRYYVAETGVDVTKFMPKTTTRIHGKGHAEAVGKRGEWTCTACGKKFKRKADCEAHMDKEHSSKLRICQEYNGEAIEPDIRFYLAQVNKLVIK